MKLLPLPSGPFKYWPFFEPHEIESSATTASRAHGVYPERPGPVNIDTLVVKLYGFDPVYEDAGDGVLGFIRFSTTKPEKIILHASLGELGSDTTEHRRRSTLAHEIGHGQLHTGMFTELMQAKKAGHATERVRSPAHTASLLCRASDVRDHESKRPLAGSTTWLERAEWQANRYMAALLVPAGLARIAVADLLGGRPEHAPINLEPVQCDLLAPEVGRLFNVSRQLAAVRLSELFPPAQAQGDLFAA